MNAAWFVTGTDTEVGKTFATCALLTAFRARGFGALGMKPVAAGVDADGRNEDVVRLQAASSSSAPVDLVNPYRFAPAIAPHVAARDAGVQIEFERIRQALVELRKLADIVLVEGVGGFRVPLDNRLDTADLAVALGLPVILVVGLRLGCINHALLAGEAIATRGLNLAGWIANSIDPSMLRPEASVDALRARISAPLLGILPHSADPQSVSHHLVLPASYLL